MTYILIETPCEICGIIHKIYYYNNGNIRFTVHNKLYSNNDILSFNGHLVCIECKHRNNIRIQTFL